MTDERVERIAAGLSGKKTQPYFVCIRPSFRCNLHCLSCWNSNSKTIVKNEVSEKRLLRLIKEGHDLGVRCWRIDGGGEPMVRAETCIKMMGLIKKLGMWGSLTTNATLFSSDYIKKIISMEWDIVNISMQGYDKKTDDFFRRVKGTYDKTIETLKLFKLWKGRLSKEKPYIKLMPVLHNKNCGHLQDFIKIAHETGAEEVGFQIHAVWTAYGKRLALKERHFHMISESAAKATEEANKFGIKTNAPSLIHTDDMKNPNRMDKAIISRAGEDKFLPCLEPWYFIIIDEFGTAGFCVQDLKTELSITNSTLEEVWNSRHFDAARERLKGGKLFRFCSRCCSPKFQESKELREMVKHALENG